MIEKPIEKRLKKEVKGKKKVKEEIAGNLKSGIFRLTCRLPFFITVDFFISGLLTGFFYEFKPTGKRVLNF